MMNCPICGTELPLAAPRAMTLADIVDPWVWAYSCHVLPNGTVFD